MLLGRARRIANIESVQGKGGSIGCGGTFGEMFDMKEDEVSTDYARSGQGAGHQGTGHYDTNE